MTVESGEVENFSYHHDTPLILKLYRYRVNSFVIDSLDAFQVQMSCSMLLMTIGRIFELGELIVCFEQIKSFQRVKIKWAHIVNRVWYWLLLYIITILISV